MVINLFNKIMFFVPKSTLNGPMSIPKGLSSVLNTEICLKFENIVLGVTLNG